MNRIEYHVRQYDEMYRSTASILEFIENKVEYEQEVTVLDIGCGGGANLHWLKEKFPEWEFVGTDIDDELLSLAREKNEGIRFENVSFYSLLDEYDANSFNYVLSTQFIASVDIALPEFIRTCCKVATQGVFLTGLFSQGWIEQETKAHNLKDGWEGTYRVYSLPRLKRVVEEVNAEVEYRKFEIDIDLPEPEEPEFRTYTKELADGRRLQISGYILMPWYEVYVYFS